MRLYPSSEFLCNQVVIKPAQHFKFVDNRRNPKY